jgi:hypothetical protein
LAILWIRQCESGEKIYHLDSSPPAFTRLLETEISVRIWIFLLRGEHVDRQIRLPVGAPADSGG